MTDDSQVQVKEELNDTGREKKTSRQIRRYTHLSQASLTETHFQLINCRRLFLTAYYLTYMNKMRIRREIE